MASLFGMQQVARQSPQVYRPQPAPFPGGNYGGAALPSSVGSLLSSLLSGGGVGGLLQQALGYVGSVLSLGSVGQGAGGIGGILSSLLGGSGGGAQGLALAPALGGGAGLSSYLGGAFGGGVPSQADGGIHATAGYGGIGVDVGGLIGAIGAVAQGGHKSANPNLKAQLSHESQLLQINPHASRAISAGIQKLVGKKGVSAQSLQSLIDYLPPGYQDEGQLGFVKGVLHKAGNLSGKQLNDFLSATGPLLKTTTLNQTTTGIGSTYWAQAMQAQANLLQPQYIPYGRFQPYGPGV